MPDSSLLIKLAAVLFGLAGVFYIWRVFVCETAGRLVSLIPIVGSIILCFGVVGRSIEMQQVPFTNLSGALAFMALALAVIYLLMEQRRRIGALGTFVFGVATIALLISIFAPQQINLIPLPAPTNLWGMIHFGASLLAYVAFTLAFLASITYMLQEYMLKRKQITRLQRHLPSLDMMDDLAYRMVTLGFLLLTVGIIAGVLWVQSTLRELLVSKGIWLLITWLVYAAYLHVRVVRGWQGKWSNRLLVLGFACILAGFISVLVACFGADSTYFNLHRFEW